MNEWSWIWFNKKFDILCLGFYITFLAILQIVIFIGFLCTKPRSLKKRVPSKGHGLPGRLIVIEGLDGSGKSTQLYLLQGKHTHTHTHSHSNTFFVCSFLFHFFSFLSLFLSFFKNSHFTKSVIFKMNQFCKIFVKTKWNIWEIKSFKTKHKWNQPK
jgi:adenylylsulfate kinase-like enzyme